MVFHTSTECQDFAHLKTFIDLDNATGFIHRLGTLGPGNVKLLEAWYYSVHRNILYVKSGLLRHQGVANSQAMLS